MDYNYGYYDMPAGGYGIPGANMSGMPTMGMSPVFADPARMMQLGFSEFEINVFNEMSQWTDNVTTQKLLRCGIDYQRAQQIKYLADIVYGKVSIESEDDLIKHLKKMRFSNRKTGIQDLGVSKISTMERRCIIAGMPAGTPFVLYNHGKKMQTFKVDNVTPGRVWIKTPLIPKLPYKDSKKLVRVHELATNGIRFYRDYPEIPKSIRDNDTAYKVETVAEIVSSNGREVELWFDRDYCRLLGRFIIVGSVRRPELHLGMVQIICLDGTRVYVFAKQAAQGENVKYSGGTERVYAYGFEYSDIIPKLLTCANEINQRVNGVYATQEPATIEFQRIENRATAESDNAESLGDGEGAPGGNTGGDD